MLDYKLIEAMAMVISEEGFDKAAEVLHITQSAISQRIKLLEEGMGQILITRGKPPKPTKAGKALIKHLLQVRCLENNISSEYRKTDEKQFYSVIIGINADSLATWFPAVIQGYLTKNKVTLDIRVDDQDQTHHILREGEAIGCISTLEAPIQGCKIDYLGSMKYKMVATPDFAKCWFPNGLTLASVRKAPAIFFNRKDELHKRHLTQVIRTSPDYMPVNYVPSHEKFAQFITMGTGYGMLPIQQCTSYLHEGSLVNLSPSHTLTVKLFWHCWKLKSTILKTFSDHLVKNARKELAQD